MRIRCCLNGKKEKKKEKTKEYKEMGYIMINLENGRSESIYIHNKYYFSNERI